MYYIILIILYYLTSFYFIVTLLLFHIANLIGIHFFSSYFRSAEDCKNGAFVFIQEIISCRDCRDHLLILKKEKYEIRGLFFFEERGYNVRLVSSDTLRSSPKKVLKARAFFSRLCN